MTNKPNFRTKRQRLMTNFIQSMTLLKKVKTNKSNSMTNKIVFMTKRQRLVTNLSRVTTKITNLRTNFRTIKTSV